MRLNLILVLVLAAGVAGCDQQQTKILEIERQLQAKDKTIAALAQSNNDLQQQLSKLQAGENSDRLAETITDSVAKRLEKQQTASFGEIKKQLDEINKSQKANPSVADSGGQRGANPGVQQPKSSEATDPNRKRYKFDF